MHTPPRQVALKVVFLGRRDLTDEHRGILSSEAKFLRMVRTRACARHKPFHRPVHGKRHPLFQATSMSSRRVRDGGEPTNPLAPTPWPGGAPRRDPLP
jgi:hypothetical protein